MREEHESFMAWAATYEDRIETGRNSNTDLIFLISNCEHFISFTEDEPIQKIVSKIINFVTSVKQG